MTGPERHQKAKLGRYSNATATNGPIFPSFQATHLLGAGVPVSASLKKAPNFLAGQFTARPCPRTHRPCPRLRPAPLDLLVMGLFTSKKKKAEKEAARAALVAREAASLQAAQAKRAETATAAKKAAATEKQDLIITEMRGMKGKIALWEKKVAKLEADKAVVLGRLSAAKQKGLKLNEVDKRKLAKVNRDLKLTQAQLETLENKLSGIEQANANEDVVNVVENANKVTDAIAPSIDKVEDVLAKADDQAKDLEDANTAFLVNTMHDDVDDDDLLAELGEYELANDIVSAKPAPAAASTIPSVPTTAPARPARASAAPAEDDEEAEMRRLEQSMAAV